VLILKPTNVCEVDWQAEWRDNAQAFTALHRAWSKLQHRVLNRQEAGVATSSPPSVRNPPVLRRGRAVDAVPLTEVLDDESTSMQQSQDAAAASPMNQPAAPSPRQKRQASSSAPSAKPKRRVRLKAAALETAGGAARDDGKSKKSRRGRANKTPEYLKDYAK